jgi:hypothetical protein
MKKLFVAIICIVGSAFLVMLILEMNKSTANNASPANLYNKDHTIDFILYNDAVYVNASNIDWIKELTFNSNKTLGTIKRTKITKNFKNFDATLLKVGSVVYSTVEREDVILAFAENRYIPYYKYVEG